MNRLDALRAWAERQGIDALTSPTLLVIGPSTHPVVANADIDIAHITPPNDIRDARAAGAREIDRLVDAGCDGVALAGDDDDAALTTIGVITKRDAAAILGMPTDIDDQTWMSTCAALRDRMRTVRSHLGDPAEFLAALDSPGLAYLVGAIAQAGARRTPVILDGLSALAAALLVLRSDTKAHTWWIIAHRVDHAAFEPARERLDLEPVLDLGLVHEVGVGAALAVPIVQAALLR